MIEVTKIKKSYNSNLVLDNISFKLNPGEVVGLLGPNGAGKTTTMRIMSGYISPDSGDVKVNGVSITKDPITAQHNIGYLPENNPLYKDFLVKDQLEISAALKNIKNNELYENIKYAVNSVNISDVYYRPIRELSKGYRQRVGLALALVSRPKLLILDEPTEGLDPNQRAEIRSLIKKLAKDQVVLLSTHVMQEVESMCDRVVVINRGKIVADDQTEALKKRFSSAKVLNLQVEGSDIETTLRSIEGINNTEVTGKDGTKVNVRVYLGGINPVQPQISKKAAEKGWTIWKLVEESQALEDLFHEITL